MQWALRSFVTSMLILSAAASIPVASGQAGPHQQAAPDYDVRENEGATTLSRPTTQSISSVGLDSVFIHIDVYDNGTAQWRIEYRVRLNDSATETAFQRLQRNLDEGSGAANQEFYDRINRSIRTAENATGRNMSGADFDTRTTIRRIPEKLGVIAYSFQWRGFAEVSDQRIHVGDALEGFLLDSDERLLISWPSTHELSEVEPAADSREEGTVVWRGPTTFGPDGPDLLFTSQSSTQPQFLLLGVVAAVACVAVFGLIQRSGIDALVPLPKRADGETGGESKLLSNEEQVLRLLEEHGGRVKQRTVADELGWTSTKTSYVVSNLREEGQIQSFRLGRENVLRLSDSTNVQKQDA